MPASKDSNVVDHARRLWLTLPHEERAVRKLAARLREQGIKVGKSTIAPRREIGEAGQMNPTPTILLTPKEVAHRLKLRPRSSSSAFRQVLAVQREYPSISIHFGK
jgi:hypothetical protein